MSAPNKNQQVAAVAGPERQITASIKLNISNKYGQSEMLLLHESLVSHRYTLNSCFFEELRQANYEAAYAYWQNIEDINDVIDQIVEALAKLASDNNYAAEYAANPGGYSNWINGLPADKASRYETFLKMVKPETPIV